MFDSGKEHTHLLSRVEVVVEKGFKMMGVEYDGKLLMHKAGKRMSDSI